jgi:hypothetical protein
MDMIAAEGRLLQGGEQVVDMLDSLLDGSQDKHSHGWDQRNGEIFKK